MTDPDYICGETTEIQDWTQIKVTVKLEELDTAMVVKATSSSVNMTKKALNLSPLCLR